MNILQKKIKKISEYIKSHPSIIIILLIIIIAFLLRLFLLVDNFSLGGDAARDAIMIKQAILRMEIPQIGPFSSAGPFVTGPLYYWFLILASLLLPFGFFDPWVLLLIVGVLNVCIFVYIGYLIKGYSLAIILGILSATSFQLIHFSLNLTNPIFVPFFTSLLILFYLLLIKKKNIIYALFGGLTLGIVLNFHYQALNLLIFIPFIFLIKDFSIKNKIFSFLLIIIGIIIPLIPLFYWDSKQTFSNFYNILDYLLVAQYRIYVPNSWKIFIFQDMFMFWGYAIGGFKITGLISMLILGIGAILAFFDINKNRNKSEIYLIPVILFILLFVNRYYHGVRQEVYLLYLTPLIIISVGLSFYYIYYNKYVRKWLVLKLLTILLFIILIMGNLYLYIDTVNRNSGNYRSYKDDIQSLRISYPDKKFSVYDWHNENNSRSIPFSLLLSEEGLQSEDGLEIAIGNVSSDENIRLKSNSISRIGGVTITDISSLSPVLIKAEFKNVNEETVYSDLMGWASKHELTHTFRLGEFIKEKFKL